MLGERSIHPFLIIMAHQKGLRVKKICLNSAIHNLVLKACHRTLDFWSCFECSTPRSSLRRAMVFFLCLIVAWAWKNFVHKSPDVTHLMAARCFQYNIWRYSSLAILLWRISRKFHSSSERSRCSSRLSSSYRINLIFLIILSNLGSDRCHSLRALRVFLNLAVNFWVGFR